jgi:hypothetical protein
METCSICEGKIFESTLEKYPDSEICGNCLDDTDVKSNIDICYQAVNKQTGERREGSFDDLSNLEKRVWILTPCIWKEPEPLCVLKVVDNNDWTQTIKKEIYSHHDLVGLYV